MTPQLLTESLSFPTRTVQGLDMLPPVCPTSSLLFQLWASQSRSQNPEPRPRPYLMNKVHRMKTMRPTMLGASHHWVT